MCYSAMIKAEYARYLRATGAQMDISQFMEIFGWEVGGKRLEVPRAVELWFDNPASDAEAALRELIRARRQKQETALQTELFAQKRRLADAQRKLATKQTKAALNDQRIAGNNIDRFVKKLNLIADPKLHASDARFFEHHYVPIVLLEGGRKVVKLAGYHLDPDGKRGHYNARRDNLQYWRSPYGSTHAVMLLGSFYENVRRDGANKVLHFIPRPQEDMLVACLYQKQADGRYAFAAVTDDPPPEIAAAGHDRVIINLKPANVDAWLAPQGKPEAQLQAILADRQPSFYEHELAA
jgi:putative SOS response-associated peptidase YedK